jgi:hypothetical protein
MCAGGVAALSVCTWRGQERGKGSLDALFPLRVLALPLDEPARLAEGSPRRQVEHIQGGGERGEVREAVVEEPLVSPKDLCHLLRLVRLAVAVGVCLGVVVVARYVPQRPLHARSQPLVHEPSVQHL